MSGMQLEKGAMGARLLPFTAIPIIDIGALSSNDRAALVEVAHKIGEACKTVGFFYIKNHGIPEALIERTYAHSKSFHRSPAILKERVHVRHSPGSRGPFITTTRSSAKR